LRNICSQIMKRKKREIEKEGKKGEKGREV
jgi:hypothetical protein